VIFGFENNIRYPSEDSVPFTILINPKIEPLQEDMEEGIEGCLSVPGLSGSVPRYTKIRYQGFDPKGQIIDRTVTDFHARVVQHECDHLDGILYPARIKDFSTFGFIE
jgi:peptide deformylase